MANWRMIFADSSAKCSTNEPFYDVQYGDSAAGTEEACANWQKDLLWRGYAAIDRNCIWNHYHVHIRNRSLEGRSISHKIPNHILVGEEESECPASFHHGEIMSKVCPNELSISWRNSFIAGLRNKKFWVFPLGLIFLFQDYCSQPLLNNSTWPYYPCWLGRSSSTVRYDSLCDGVFQCEDRSDEANCKSGSTGQGTEGFRGALTYAVGEY